MEYIRKYRLQVFLISIILFLLSYVIHFYTNRPIKLSSAVKTLSVGLSDMEQDYYELTEEKSIMRVLVDGTYSDKVLNLLQDKPYSILVYVDDDLVFWNKKEISIPKSSMASLPPGLSYDVLKNGYYQILKMPIVNVDSDSELYIVGLQLIQNIYDYENKYLTNQLNDYLSLPQGIKFSTEDNNETEPILRDDERNSVFVTYDQVAKTRPNRYAVGLSLVSVFLWLVLLTSFAIEIAGTRNKWMGFLFLTVTFCIVRAMLMIFNIPPNLSDYPLFTPDTNVAFVLGRSLGDIFFNAIWIFWLSMFFRTVPNAAFIKNLNKNQKILTHTAIIFAHTAFTALIIIFLKYLIIDLQNSVNIGEIVDLSNSSLLTLLIIGLLMTSYFFIGQKIAELLYKFRLKNIERTFSILFALIPFVIWLNYFNYSWIEFLVIPILLIFLFGRKQFMVTHYEQLKLGNITSWLIFYALFASIFIGSYEFYKEKQKMVRFAENLAIEKDIYTEFLFEDVSLKITKDKTLAHSFENPFLPKAELVQRIKRYFGSYFTKYDIRVIPFHFKGQSLTGKIPADNTLDYYEAKIRQGIGTKSSYLYLINNSLGASFYLAKVGIFNDESPLPIGFLIIEMVPKSDKQLNVYPELVIEDKYRKEINFEDYDYGVYREDTLRVNKGKFHYDFLLKESYFLNLTDNFLMQNDFYHYAYKGENQKTIVVSRKNFSFNKLLSIFSFNVFFFVLIAAIAVLLIPIYGWGNFKVTLHKLLYSSLRQRVNLSVIMIVLLSFIIIGTVTLLYFSNRSTEYHNERLERKEKSIKLALEEMIKRTKSNYGGKKSILSDKPSLEEQISTISEIHVMDINIYDLKGELISSSQPIIFDKGIISKLMAPDAFFKMRNRSLKSFIHNENIGDLNYLASYVPLTNEMGERIAYLNIPYYAKERNLKQQISRFLETLFVVYVLLLVGASILALRLSNSITQSLSIIREKLKEIRLGKRNEMLEWPDDDEIGELVKQYNQTIFELDRSAALLAKSERESAWQQMAKQVAHEIKNPLTPMKLSIQHLQRAYQTNAPELPELTDKVTRNLIEQIDNLSNIASSFSSFAQMPQTNEEVVNIKDIIKAATGLYDETSIVKIIEVLPEKDYFVFADKNQLMRVFNNILKNAVQAIPVDTEGVIIINLNESPENEDALVIGIADNGKGIAEDQKDKVFVPNFTTKTSGMGLGLAMSKNIILNANGRIWFDSAVGQGTTFFIELPIHQLHQNN